MLQQAAEKADAKLQQSQILWRHVRFGSVAEINTLIRHVRFSAGTTPRNAIG